MVIWLALAVSLADFAAGLAFAIARGLALFRGGKRTGARLGDELESISRATTQIEVHLARADAKSAELQAALERLRASQARLQVQLAAVREARTLVSWALPFLPKQ